MHYVETGRDKRSDDGDWCWWWYSNSSCH